MKHKHLFFSLIVFNLFVLILVYFLVQGTEGKYIYPLDDTYIHMAVSKNIVQNGTWGINKGVFTSVSSSPFFTILLSLLFYVFGVNEYIPLVLNILLINVFFISSYFFLKDVSKFYKITYWLFFCLSNIFALLYVQVLSGMEHVLHILVSFYSFVYFYKITPSSNITKKNKLIFLLIILISVLVRYESLFFVLPMFFVLAYLRHWKMSFLILFFAVLPIILFGVYSIYHGGYFLPNSLLVKSGGQLSIGFQEKLYYYFKKIIELIRFREFSLPIIISVFCTLYFVLLKSQSSKINKNKILLLIVSIFTILIHSIFANFGWFFRYEAYLFVVFILAIIIFVEEINLKAVFLIYTISLSYLLFYTYNNRVIYSVEFIKKAGKNVYEQQYLNGRLLKEQFKDKNVILADLGAVAFLSDCKIFDLAGLGSNEVAMLKFKNNYDRLKLLKKISENYDLIIMPKGWLVKVDPKNETKWIKVVDFTISDNIYCASDKIEIYAKNIITAKELKKGIVDFNGKIPKDVEYQLH